MVAVSTNRTDSSTSPVTPSASSTCSASRPHRATSTGMRVLLVGHEHGELALPAPASGGGEPGRTGRHESAGSAPATSAGPGTAARS